MKRYILSAVFYCIAFTASSSAHILSVRSEYNFDQAVTQAPFAVVYLYHSKLPDDNFCDRPTYKDALSCYKRTTGHNRKILKIVTNRYRYKMAGVQGIAVDVSKSDNCGFIRKYMQGQDEMFLFFANGRLEETMPCFSGVIERITLENIIEDLWQKELDEIIQKKEAARRQQADDRRMAHAWWWSSGGYPFPYGGYSYWGCPGWGCGGYGYGYPYYGGGCGSRGYVNVGFGFSC